MALTLYGVRLRCLPARARRLVAALGIVALVACESPRERAAAAFEQAACACRDRECYFEARGNYTEWVSANPGLMGGDWRHAGPAQAAAARAEECGAAYVSRRCGGAAGSCPAGTVCRGKVERSPLHMGNELVFYCLPPEPAAAAR
jgi:hypothetical protein